MWAKDVQRQLFFATVIFNCRSTLKSSSGVKFYILTHADRSRTTVLLPEEYSGLKGRLNNADCIVMAESRELQRVEMALSMNLGWRIKHFGKRLVAAAPRNSRFLASSRVIFLVVLFFAIRGLAQGPLTGILTKSMGDVAAVKQKAEAGDAGAQVSFGNILSYHLRQAEALSWYRKAAAQGNIDAEYSIGQMLVFGASGDSTNAVRANPAEGLRWTFMAATNLITPAYYTMSKALRQGLGTSRDPMAAYAWLVLLSETPTSTLLARSEMNEMALKMSTADIHCAQNLAGEFKARHWQLPVIRVIPDGDPRLKLTGVVFGMKNPMAVINGKTVGEGASAKISLKPDTLNIKCLRIEKDSVSIFIEGEDQPRVLRLSH